MKETVRSIYPDALEGNAFTIACLDQITGKYGFEKDKTLLATSVCSDEIIRSATSFRDHLEIRNPFQLGGLAGYPFTGLTGLAAFLSHLPDGGEAVILYGPHIGISEAGNVGLMRRAGQGHESGCCGALKASLAAMLDSDTPSADSELDYQLWKIEEALFRQRDEILERDEPLVEATEEMYRVIDGDLETLLKRSGELIAGHRVALVGGIIINTDHPLPDWFAPRRLEVIGVDGKSSRFSIDA